MACSSDRNRRFKTIRNIAVGAIALVFLAGCEGCPEVAFRTHKEAYEALKKEVLANHLKELKDIGADESIFDNVQIITPRTYESKLGLSDHPCNRPRKYSTITGQQNKNGDYIIDYVKTFEIMKGACDKCWDLVIVSGIVSRCGDVYVRMRRNPTPKFGPGLEQCGPAYDYP